VLAAGCGSGESTSSSGGEVRYTESQVADAANLDYKACKPGQANCRPIYTLHGGACVAEGILTSPAAVEDIVDPTRLDKGIAVLGRGSYENGIATNPDASAGVVIEVAYAHDPVAPCLTEARDGLASISLRSRSG
jgi:hypothetical protein